MCNCGAMESFQVLDLIDPMTFIASDDSIYSILFLRFYF